MVQAFYGKMSFLVRFQVGRRNYLTLNQLTIVTVEKRPVNEEAKVTTISAIPDESIYLIKGCDNVVYFILRLRRRTVLIWSSSSHTWNHIEMRRIWRWVWRT